MPCSNFGISLVRSDRDFPRTDLWLDISPFPNSKNEHKLPKIVHTISKFLALHFGGNVKKI